MNIQLEKVAAQIKDYTESLTYAGLNFVSQDDIKKIEFFLQNASQLEAYRLATSLRYLHVELERFFKNRAAFNIERYVFFLSNCWLLSRAFVSQQSLKEERRDIYDKLMGPQLKPEVESKLILRVIGTETVHLEGTMVGFTFYFLSLFGKTRDKILKWNLMLPYKSGVSPESLLYLDLPNSQPPSMVETILLNCVEAENIPCILKEDIVYLEKNPDSKIFIDEESSKDTHVSISKLDKYYLDSTDIYKKITENYEITPFDLPATFLDYLYVKNVTVIEVQKEEEKETVYKITHEKKYPLCIRIPEKQGNLKLIEEFNKFKGKNKPIEGIFCKLILERGQLSLYPLGLVNEEQILFPNLRERAPDNRALLKEVYKIK